MEFFIRSARQHPHLAAPRRAAGACCSRPRAGGPCTGRAPAPSGEGPNAAEIDCGRGGRRVRVGPGGGARRRRARSRIPLGGMRRDRGLDSGRRRAGAAAVAGRGKPCRGREGVCVGCLAALVAVVVTSGSPPAYASVCVCVCVCVCVSLSVCLSACVRESSWVTLLTIRRPGDLGSCSLTHSLSLSHFLVFCLCLSLCLCLCLSLTKPAPRRPPTYRGTNEKDLVEGGGVLGIL